ncbi:MAG TPA: dihydrofolate reductase [Chitinophagaceae bacterium]|nr:dihydrofolate reductase [Chitinophagaceae bacterium]
MIISLIVAVSTNNVIGKNNKLLWHLPNDLKFFKNTTWGMPVIMGRKTYDSIGRKPLPGRFNIIITRDFNGNPVSNDISIAKSFEVAIEKAKETDCREVFVVGGGEIYRQSMPIANRIYLTRVHAEIEGDVLFPPLNEKEWEQTYNLDFDADDKHAYPYSFQIWERKRN